MSKFKALIADQKDSQFTASIQEIDQSALPPGEVLVRVAYSSLNYKDGLAVTGKPGVIRKFPMVPGVDFAGTVVESSSAAFHAGDEVVVTGCGTSEVFWGGYAQYARLDAEFIVPVPKGMTLRQTMGIGTAGFTAMQSVLALEHHGVTPGEEVLVTGAAGGVGSVAVAILAKLGYKVAASTGRPQFHDYLKSLGAAEILDRATVAAPSKRPMETARWAAAVDSVGGDTLAGVLRSMAIGGAVSVCGLAGRTRAEYHCISVHPARRRHARDRFHAHAQRQASRDLVAPGCSISPCICWMASSSTRLSKKYSLSANRSSKEKFAVAWSSTSTLSAFSLFRTSPSGMPLPYRNRRRCLSLLFRSSRRSLFPTRLYPGGV